MSFQALNSVRRAAGNSSNELVLFPDLLEKSRMEIQRALPKHLDSDRMMWLALSAFRLNPKLEECDPMSVMAAVVQASQMGLEIGLNGEAYLVPFKRECQLITGYQGLMKLARQSGFVDDIYAMEVYERDAFEIDYGAGRKLVHKPFGQSNGFPVSISERGNLVGFYAVAMLTSGETAFIHLAKKDCEDIRDSSAGYRFAKKNGQLHPWMDKFTEMGKKSVIRQLTKQLPKSAHLSLALNLDALSHEGLKQRITLQQAADGTYEPTPAHFNAQPEGEGKSQPAQPPQGGHSTGPVQPPSQPTRSYGARPPAQGGYAPNAKAPTPAPASAQPHRPTAPMPPPTQRQASAPRQATVAAPAAQRSAPPVRQPMPSQRAPAPTPQTPSEEASLKAAAPYLERMRQAPNMDRVNDIYIEAEDRLNGAGLEAISREYMVLKTNLERNGTRALFS